MKNLRILCFAFALTAFFMSFVVYGRVAQVNHNSCLVIGFRSSANSPSKAKTKVSHKALVKVQSLLNYANIPLEISYIKSGKQFDSFGQFLALFQPQTDQQVLADKIENLENIQTEKITAVKIDSEPINKSVEIALEAQTNDSGVYQAAADTAIEKPVLRMPENNL